MPATTAVHIDRALSNVSIYFRNPSYCADVLSPIVNVNKESDKYFVYNKDNFRIPVALRQDKAETTELQYTLSFDSYFAQEYGYHELISDRERENSDDALRPDYDTTEHITECLLLDREYRVANNVLNSANLHSWDDIAGAFPMNDIYHGKYVVFLDSRKQANTIFIPVEVAYQLAQMEQVLELRKYTDPGLLTDAGLPPKLWGLNVVEAESTYDQSADGSPTSTFVETWGDNVVIAFINPNPITLKTLTFSLTFQKRAFETRKWREEKRRSDVIEVTHLYDSKIVAPAAGYVMLNTMTVTATGS